MASTRRAMGRPPQRPTPTPPGTGEGWGLPSRWRTFHWRALLTSCCAKCSCAAASLRQPAHCRTHTLQCDVRRRVLAPGVSSRPGRGSAGLAVRPPLSRIVQITVDQVSASGDFITLGDTPLLMPPPLDALVNELLHGPRKGHALMGRHIDSPGCLPAGTPESPWGQRSSWRV